MRYLYDNKIVIGFNHKKGTDTVTFDEAKEAIQEKWFGFGLPWCTKTLKRKFQGLFPFSETFSQAKLCARFSGGNLVGRIKMKQVEGLGNITVETAIEEF